MNNSIAWWYSEQWSYCHAYHYMVTKEDGSMTDKICIMTDEQYIGAQYFPFIYNNRPIYLYSYKEY